ncbi:MAG: FtsW/RodA/SpoVE family cell cycle protein, partial [Chloroflexota bacterium]|nr:FtsW/RodA/SpoVE family cell cycle protein [Chloroflexota bacterium]
DGALSPRSVTALAAFAGAFLAAHVWLTVRVPFADQLLLPLVAAICALGQIVVSRLVPELAVRQSLWVGVGVTALLGVVTVLPGLGWLRRYRYTWAAVGTLLVLSTFVLGIDPNGSGARLWLGAGGVYFQPSEVFKVLLVVFFAAYLDDYRELLTYAGPRIGPLTLPPLPYLTPLLGMLTLALLVVVLQRDLGAALLFFGVFLALLYAASGRALYVVLGLALFMLGATLLYQLFDHVQLRVDIWLDPWSRAERGGFQVVQGLTALAAGGLFGTGLDYGYPEYVPAAHTDFVIAAIGEELGLAGALAVVALYMLVVHRGFHIALATRDSFAGLLAVGLTAVVGIQALVILGGTLKLMPLTGVTLPLLSYGGSSILANFILLGLLMLISHESEARRAAEH